MAKKPRVKKGSKPFSSTRPALHGEQGQTEERDNSVCAHLSSVVTLAPHAPNMC